MGGGARVPSSAGTGTGFAPGEGGRLHFETPVGAPYSHAGDLERLLEHLGVERAHLVGLSLGGTVSIDFALRKPESVRSLTLISSGLAGYRRRFPAVDSVLRPVYERAREAGPEAAKGAWLGGPLFRP